jgi:poly-gamma-glutamate synthesis protein (capsule biosynthesis protein)
MDLNAFDHRNDTLLVLTTIDSVTNRFLTLAIDSVNFFKNPDTYPLWIEGRGFSYANSITRYTHTGVTAITRQTGVMLDRISPEEYLSQVLDYFKTSELVHISNEVSLMDDCSYGTMRLQFATKRKHFELIRMLGADIIELTGNHNLDFGKEPYMQSLQWYTENGMRYFGGGPTLKDAAQPLVLELKTGGKVAWIGYNELCPLGECAGKGPGAMRYEKTVVQKTIDSLRNKVKVDYIIACVQFGETDSYSPTSSQKRICQEIIELGADVILGSQAHQAQEVAFHQGKPMFYGLGNFLFDQIHRKGVRQAFFLECYFYKGRIIQFHPVYTYMSDKRIPTPANEVQKQEIRSAILKPSNF